MLIDCLQQCGISATDLKASSFAILRPFPRMQLFDSCRPFTLA